MPFWAILKDFAFCSLAFGLYMVAYNYLLLKSSSVKTLPSKTNLLL